MEAVPTVEVEGVLPLPDDLGRLWLRPYHEAEPREPNLTCYDYSGERLWDAEQLHALDKWVAVRVEDNRLFANSFGGYLCELDPRDGTIMFSTFVK